MRDAPEGLIEDLDFLAEQSADAAEMPVENTIEWAAARRLEEWRNLLVRIARGEPGAIELARAEVEYDFVAAIKKKYGPPE